MSDEISEQLELFADYIRKEGLRMTRQRRLIVETFLRSEGHLSTDELHGLVKEKDVRVGYATVFRALKALTACGLARETDLADGRTRFEHLYKHPHHHHIICTECKRTIEFLSPELESLEEQIVSEYDFEPVRSTFQIFGLCRDCQKQQSSTQQNYQPDLVFARDALRIAMETERRGINFYTEAAKLVSEGRTRATFLSMLQDEEEHFSRLKEQWDRLIEEHEGVLDAPVFLHFDFAALKRIFPSRGEISQKLRSEITEEEALRLAMGMERDARRFFNKYAERFSDTRGRDIFLRFAEEEQEHIDIIKDAYEKLTAAADAN